MPLFRLSFGCFITAPFRPRMVMCTASCDIPSHFRRFATLMMLSAPQSMIAHPSCISSFLCRICTSWTICVEFCNLVPQRYCLNILTIRLSSRSLDFTAIRCCRTSSRVAINACMPNFSIPTSICSNLPSHTRYQDRYTSCLLAECQRIFGDWLVNWHLGCLGLCMWHLRRWLCHGSSAWGISDIGRFYCHRRIRGIFC